MSVLVLAPMLTSPLRTRLYALLRVFSKRFIFDGQKTPLYCRWVAKLEKIRCVFKFVRISLNGSELDSELVTSSTGSRPYSNRDQLVLGGQNELLLVASRSEVTQKVISMHCCSRRDSKVNNTQRNLCANLM